mmetsp:Transcript_3090/g.6936  ORF Transcript_3090/g.6936 Transcript_3090/m.6936 type:complete len:957 (+) Transcript_3090:60-2930(+)
MDPQQHQEMGGNPWGQGGPAAAAAAGCFGLMPGQFHENGCCPGYPLAPDSMQNMNAVMAMMMQGMPGMMGTGIESSAHEFGSFKGDWPDSGGKGSKGKWKDRGGDKGEKGDPEMNREVSSFLDRWGIESRFQGRVVEQLVKRDMWRDDLLSLDETMEEARVPAALLSVKLREMSEGTFEQRTGCGGGKGGKKGKKGDGKKGSKKGKGSSLDPQLMDDIIDLCSKHDIDDRLQNRLADAMSSRIRTFKEDLQTVADALGGARNPPGLLSVKIREMEDGTFVAKGAGKGSKDAKGKSFGKSRDDEGRRQSSRSRSQKRSRRRSDSRKRATRSDSRKRKSGRNEGGESEPKSEDERRSLPEEWSRRRRDRSRSSRGDARQSSRADHASSTPAGAAVAPPAEVAVPGFPQKPFDPDDEVHHGITCGGCRANPLRGDRFKCSVCANFNLCELCYEEKAKLHVASHRFFVQKAVAGGEDQADAEIEHTVEEPPRATSPLLAAPACGTEVPPSAVSPGGAPPMHELTPEQMQQMQLIFQMQMQQMQQMQMLQHQSQQQQEQPIPQYGMQQMSQQERHVPPQVLQQVQQQTVLQEEQQVPQQVQQQMQQQVSRPEEVQQQREDTGQHDKRSGREADRVKQPTEARPQPESRPETSSRSTLAAELPCSVCGVKGAAGLSGAHGAVCYRKRLKGDVAGCSKGVCWSCMESLPRAQLGMVRTTREEFESLEDAWWMHEQCMAGSDMLDYFGGEEALRLAREAADEADVERGGQDSKGVKSKKTKEKKQKKKEETAEAAAPEVAVSPSAAEKIKKMSVKELKAYLDKHGQLHENILEKAELVAKALEVAASEPPDGPAWMPVGMVCRLCTKPQAKEQSGVICRRKRSDGTVAGCGAGVCWRCMKRAPRTDFGQVRTTKEEFESLGEGAWWMHEACFDASDYKDYYGESEPEEDRARRENLKSRLHGGS